MRVAGLVACLLVGCHPARPSPVEPSLPAIAPLRSVREETPPRPPEDAEVTGKIWICVLDIDDLHPLSHRRFRLSDGGKLVLEGETDDGGCVERHRLPLGYYVLSVDGLDDIAAMLLDEDDEEPLNRMPHRARPAGASP